MNDKNALQVMRKFEKIKHFFHRMNSQYKEDFEKTKIETAEKDTIEAIRKYIVSPEKIMQRKVLRDYPSELGQAVNDTLDLELGLEFSENSVKRYPIELTEHIKREEYSKLLGRDST